jgi:signal transduction histidine kinase
MAEMTHVQYLTAAMLHECAQPLTVISILAQRLQRRGRYNRRAVDAIVSEAGRLGRLLSDTLDLARSDVAHFTVRSARVDLVGLAQWHVAQARSLADRHTFRIETPGHPVIGRWDADRLGQVLTNLLSNAIKYAPDGEEISCRIEDLGDEACLSVADSGIGIAPSELASVFEPFWRSEGAHARGVSGFGLGLYVSKMLVEAHGGSIGIESVVGHGSTFTVVLPKTGVRE